MNGTNEAPVITGGAAGATLLPSSAAAGASGQIFFADTDVSQSHTVNIASVAVNGSLANIPTLEVLQTWLSTSLVLGNSGERQLNWSFTPQGYDFSALGLTDQLTLTYRIEIVDTSGAVAARDVTIFVRASALAAGTLASVSGAVFEEDSNVDLAVPSSLFVGLLSGDITVSATLADGSPLPSWLSFDGSRLIGSPPANYNGTTELRITANNGVDAVHDFLPLFIEGVNDAPATGEAILDYRFAAGVAVSILLPDSAFSDADGDDLQLTARLTNGSPLPSWLSFSNGAFAGIAPVDFAGVLELEVRASDGISSASQSFNLVVGLANADPSVANTLYDWLVREDEYVDVMLRSGVFQDADGDSLTISATLANGDPLPLWLQFDGASFTGNPPQNFNGTLEIVVSATDGTANVADTFQLIIDPVNDAPIIMQGLSNVTVAGEAAVAIEIPNSTFSDPDGDVLTIALTLSDGTPLPSWLTFDGTHLIGTSPSEFIGTLQIAARGSDAVLSAVTQFALTVSASNRAPDLISDNLASINEELYCRHCSFCFACK